MANQVKFENALDYLEAIKKTFQATPDKYDSFLGIMKVHSRSVAPGGACKQSFILFTTLATPIPLTLLLCGIFSEKNASLTFLLLIDYRSQGLQKRKVRIFLSLSSFLPHAAIILTQNTAALG